MNANIKPQMRYFTVVISEDLKVTCTDSLSYYFVV